MEKLIFSIFVSLAIVHYETPHMLKKRTKHSWVFIGFWYYALSILSLVFGSLAIVNFMLYSSDHFKYADSVFMVDILFFINCCGLFPIFLLRRLSCLFT